MNRIEELEKLIKHNNELYWNGKELEISDIEFDKLVRELTVLDPANDLLKEFGKSSEKKIIKHSKPMLSLDKVYSIDELMKWVNKVSRTEMEEFVIQPKYDGMSGLLENGTLSSRGDGVNGQDYTDKLQIIKFDSTHKVDIKNETLLGEILISNSDFETIYKNIRSKSGVIFKNQRNGIAGILGTDDIDFYKKQGAVITFVDYNNWGVVKTVKEIEKDFLQIAEVIRSTSNYPLDGIVIKLKDTKYSESLGYTTHHPRGQIAFKFTNQTAKSKLIGVEWGMGKQQISAVGLVEPVELSGVTVKRVKLQLTSPKNSSVSTYVLDGSLQIGDDVIIERAGDIIPHIIASIPGKNRKRIILDKCPFCGGDIEVLDSSVKCCNKNCIELKVQNLLCSIVSLGFKNIGESYIRTLVNDNSLSINTIYDVLTLTKDQLKLSDYGTKMKDIFIEECNKAKQNSTKIQFLTSLNIENVGKNVSKLIVENFDWNDIINNTFDYNKLYSINGIGNVIIESIKNGFNEKKVLMQNMNKLFNFTKEEKPLEGQTICFTGKMMHKRSEMEQIAKDKGFIPIDHVDKTLNILVCADPNSGSSKLEKAKKYGIKIISENDFMKGI